MLHGASLLYGDNAIMTHRATLAWKRLLFESGLRISEHTQWRGNVMLRALG